MTTPTGDLLPDITPIAPLPPGHMVYHFDGTTGCAACQAMSSYYLSTEPKPPHKKCRCKITGKYVLKGKTQSFIRYFDANVSVQEVQGEGESNLPFSAPVGSALVTSFAPLGRSSNTSSDTQPPRDGLFSNYPPASMDPGAITVKVPAGRTYSVRYGYTSLIYLASVKRELVTFKDGKVSRKPLPTWYGTAERVVNVRLKAYADLSNQPDPSTGLPWLSPIR